MTSRISFFKLLKEEWKHHLVSVFVIVVTFLAEILFFYFDVHNILSGYEAEYIHRRMSYLSTPDFSSLITTIMLAVLVSAEYFSYLQSRKKTDFYLSLPVKRSTQFQMGVVISSIMFVIPCVLTTISEILIVVVNGYADAVFVENMLWTLVCKIAAFAVTWATMAVAVVITGHLVIALIGFGVICAYIPLFVKEIYPTFADMFYETFTRESSEAEAWYYFSPISLISGFTNSYDFSMKEFGTYLVITVLFTLVTGLAAWKLYQNRPAEAAGKAIAFEKLQAPIRFLVVIPLALYCGYFLEEMSMMESKVWLIAGTVIGAAFLHGLMESIYEFDLKNMLAKKKQMAAAMVVSLMVIAGFCLTADMFDAYIPEEDQVESVRVSLYGDNVRFYDIGSNKEGIEGEQIGMVIDLVENLILQDNNEMLDDAVEYGYSLGSMSVRYKMKDGSIKSRMYSIDTDDKENRELLDCLIGTEDFKEDYFEIYNMEDDAIVAIYLDNTFNSEQLWFSEEEQTELLDIYRKELAEQTFSEMEEVRRLAQLTIQYKTEDGWYYEDNCFIYEDFEETLSYLADKGIEVGNPMDACEILSIELSDEYDEKGDPMYVIHDREVLAEVKQEFVLADLYGMGYVDGVVNTRYGYAEVKIGNRVDYRTVYIEDSLVEQLKQVAD